MILNNRPLTLEDSVKDRALLTDLCPVAVNTAMRWVQDNVAPSTDPLTNFSSYGLKKLLEEDTGLRLTNNQMKDAMWLSGYEPEDAEALNWTFRAKFVEEIPFNPSPFVSWLGEAHFTEGETTFAEEAVFDSDFPMVADYDTIRAYLSMAEYDDELVEAFDVLWQRFEEDKISPVPKIKLPCQEIRFPVDGVTHIIVHENDECEDCGYTHAHEDSCND